MADQGGSNQRGGKRPPPKTFGDARLGIPAGSRRPEREGSQEGRSPADRQSKKDAPLPPKKGPIVEHRPGGLNVRRKVGSETETTAVAAAVAETVPAVVHEGSPVLPAEVAPSLAQAVEPEAPASARVFRSAKVEPKAAPPPAVELPVPVETESFADMFARSEGERKRFEPGQKVKAKILQVGRDTAFLDLGGKNEALIDSRELRAEDGTLRYQVGQTLEGFVRSLEDGVWVTLTIPKGARREALAQAREGGIPVEGTVTGVNKGGLEVDLGGGTRAFCPSSQADVRFVEDLSGLVGQKLKFLVSELKDRDIVFSRRAYLAREAAAKADELRDTLVVGRSSRGQGRLPARLRRLRRSRRAGGPGADLRSSATATSRIPPRCSRLARRSPWRSPASRRARTARRRSRCRSRRSRATPGRSVATPSPRANACKARSCGCSPSALSSNCFLESTAWCTSRGSSTPAGKRVTHPKDALAEGQTIWVEVETVDRTSRKLGLRPITAEEAAVPRAGSHRRRAPRVGEVVEAVVDKVESFGLFVRWPGGRGLLPVSELGTPYGADLRRAYAIGAKIKASIVEIDTQGRLRLSKIAAEQAQERAEVAEYLNANQRPGKGLGTLADLLKGRKS